MNCNAAGGTFVSCAEHDRTKHTPAKNWKRVRTVFAVHCSLFIVHCSLFTVHCSLFTVHCSLFIVHCSLSLFTVSLFTVHCSLFHCSLFTVHCSLFIVWFTVPVLFEICIYHVGYSFPVDVTSMSITNHD